MIGDWIQLIIGNRPRNSNVLTHCNGFSNIHTQHNMAENIPGTVRITGQIETTTIELNL